MMIWKSENELKQTPYYKFNITSFDIIMVELSFFLRFKISSKYFITKYKIQND